MNREGADKPLWRRRRVLIAIGFALVLVVSAVAPAVIATDFLDGFHASSGDVTYNATDGPEITLTGEHNFQDGNPFSSGVFVAKTEDNGEVRFSSTSSTQHQPAGKVHVDDLTGQWTNLTELNVSDVALSVDPEDKQRVDIQGDAETFSFRSMGVDDGSVDFAYSGPGGGETDVTIYDLNEPENRRVVAVDANGDVLGSAHVDATGTLELTGLPQSSHTVELESAPDNLTVYNESAPETVIDDRELNAEFFDLNGDKITEKSTTDGEFSLEGLDQSTFAVRLTDTEGDYADRQLIIKDITLQQSAYMLNTNGSVQTVQPTFLIDDETGNYDPTTSRVYIERGLNISNTTTYQTIAAEEVGTDGYTETIEADQRYRIIVENTDGDRRVLGKFSASDSNTYTLTVEELVFNLEPDGEMIKWGFNYTEVEDASDFVHFRYLDEDDRTSEINVVIYERGNESNELHNETYIGTFGELSIKETVPNDNSEWAVEWDASRNPDFDGQSFAGPLGAIPLPTSDRLVHTMAIGLVLLVGGLASQVNAPAVGLATAGTAGVLYYIQWLPVEVAGTMIALAMLIPVLYLLPREGFN